MRITRTPLRISFLGGGSDYPEWHKEHLGMVLGATIDKYCYIMYQPDQDKYRISYSKHEECATLGDIQHPAVKAVLEYLYVGTPCNVIHTSDLPGRSGLGSSSAFVVGLSNAIAPASAEILANTATTIEQEILQEPVGSQDQILCAKGGLNQIIWHPTGQTAVRDLELSAERMTELRRHLMLFPTHPRSVEEPTPLKYNVQDVRELAHLAKNGADLLKYGGDILDFGRMLDTGWQIKKSMSPSISDDSIDSMYLWAKGSGAIGGKLLGAGGGGYMLLFAEPRYHEQIEEALNKKPISWGFVQGGSEVIYNA